MINEQGGINGRRVNFISLDDEYSPPKTLEQTRRLVEQDDVLAIMGSFGTPTERGNSEIPERERRAATLHPSRRLAVGRSGPFPLDDTVRQPSAIGSKGLCRTTYYASTPRRASRVLYQNDDFGRDYLDGLKEKLGAQAARMIVGTASYETSDPTVDSQIVALHSSDANTLLIAAGPKFAAQAIRKVFEIGWHPTRFIAQVSASPTVLKPAGLDKSRGRHHRHFLQISRRSAMGDRSRIYGVARIHAHVLSTRRRQRRVRIRRLFQRNAIR